jgi:hypothetical protein
LGYNTQHGENHAQNQKDTKWVLGRSCRLCCLLVE